MSWWKVSPRISSYQEECLLFCLLRCVWTCFYNSIFKMYVIHVGYLTGTFIQWLGHELVLGLGPFGQLPMHPRRQAQPESKGAFGMFRRNVILSFWSPRSWWDQGAEKGAKYGQAPSIPCTSVRTHGWPHSWVLRHSHYLLCNFYQKWLQYLIPIVKHSTSDHCGAG